MLPDIPRDHILLEPEARNTAPCIAYASRKISLKYPDANIIVTPADAYVPDNAAFAKTMSEALKFTSDRKAIVCVGIQPTRPETGYGYINAPGITDTVVKTTAFKEKPDLATAERYLAEGGYYWNAGIFVWNVRTIEQELRTYAPQIEGVMDELEPSLYTPREQDELARLFPTCEKISIDYAVMEKTKIAYVMPAEFGWSDLGTWGSLHTLTNHDTDKNAVIGDGVKMIECEGNMVKMPNGKQVVIQGLKNCIVSEHNGTLLICQLSEEQRIKEWHD